MAKFRRTYPNTLATSMEQMADLSEKQLLAVARASFQDVIHIAQTPVAKGGRMRVKTGFLRASGQLSLNGMPTGPVRGDKDAKIHQYDDGNKPVNVELLTQSRLGSVMYFGWTAAYARYREVYDGFLEGALQRWSTIVAFHVQQAKDRIK